MAPTQDKDLAVVAPTANAKTLDGATTETHVLEIDGIAYDVTRFAKEHPGGQVILSYSGRDATDVFYAFHSKETHKRLTLLPRSKDTIRHSVSQPLLDDFRILRKSLDARGLLDASSAWYLYKVASTLALGAAGIFVAIAWHWVIIGSLMLGLCWQQMGWVAHEICHHGWFKNRRLGHIMSFILGNLCQGFDVFWWSDRHNQHHAVPNVLGGHEAQGDPDIDNLPVVAWDESDLKRVTEWPQWGKNLLQYQHIYFFFVMPLLRLIWAMQSLRFVPLMPTSKNPLHRQYYLWSKYTLYAFWFWQVVVIYFMPSIGSGLLFLTIANLLGGAGIAFVVFFNHHSFNKCDGNAAVDNFVTLQTEGTRNMEPSPFVDWLWGGLNYQIEHHLFPTAPRHNLSVIRPEVQALLKKHNVPYYSDSFISGVKQMCNHLSAVAAKLDQVEAKKDN